MLWSANLLRVNTLHDVHQIGLHIVRVELGTVFQDGEGMFVIRRNIDDVPLLSHKIMPVCLDVDGTLHYQVYIIGRIGIIPFNLCPFLREELPYLLRAFRLPASHFQIALHNAEIKRSDGPSPGAYGRNIRF